MGVGDRHRDHRGKLQVTSGAGTGTKGRVQAGGGNGDWPLWV